MAIICQCAVVKERTIVKAIERGATTIAAIQDECGAAAQCGGCTEAVEELLARHGAGAGDRPPVSSLAPCVATPR